MGSAQLCNAECANEEGGGVKILQEDTIGDKIEGARSGQRRAAVDSHYGYPISPTGCITDDKRSVKDTVFDDAE